MNESKCLIWSLLKPVPVPLVNKRCHSLWNILPYRNAAILKVKLINYKVSKKFEIKGDKVTWNWKELHSEKLHNYYVIVAIKSGKTRWVAYIARVGQVRKTNT